MKKPTKAQEQALEFAVACKQHGFSYEINLGGSVRIFKEFTPGDKQAYSECDMMAGHVLGLAPLKGGSIWGTDGGSVGGYIGLQKGLFTMNKTGTGDRFLKALANSRS
jgi:hypothetical protein